MRERIFSSVDLPAPFRPITPSASPGATSKLTSLSAQSVLWFDPPLRRQRLSGAFAAPTIVSRSVAYDSLRVPSRYCLLRPWTLTIGFISYHYTTSANSLSIRRNQKAEHARTTIVIRMATPIAGQLKGLPNSAERNASMMPLTGLSIITVRNFGGSALLG